jgi:hypothetical protein
LIATHPPTQLMEQDKSGGKKRRGEERGKNRCSSTSRIVDITETGTSQGRTRQVIVEREGGKRQGVVRRCVDERALQKWEKETKGTR